jgi:hypothetical protein
VARRTIATAAALAGLVAVTGACGDDKDTAAKVSDGKFCQLARDLEAQEDFPTAAQLTAYRDAAPDPIRSDVRAVVARFLKAIEAGTPEAPYSDPDIEAAFAPIDDYEADVCGIEEKD